MRAAPGLLGMIAGVPLGAVGCGGGPAEDERTRAIAAARAAYAAAEEEGADFSRGPCLGVVLEGWVADIAHDPRQDVDDEPENQCEAYRSGEAGHFVELDLDGDLIRAE
jgi:hypothetical protein